MMAPAIKNNIGGFLLGVTKTLATLLPKKSKTYETDLWKSS
jgi:hypothetical protein